MLHTALQVKRHTFTTSEYDAMTLAGVFGEDDRVELIEGEIIEMSPIGSDHAGVVNRLTWMLIQRLGDRAIVATQNPIRLGEHSEPQPDVVVAKFRKDFYRSSHPTPDDVLLVVEIADATLAIDRDVKVPLYASAKIAEVWLINLLESSIEVYSKPEGRIYREKRTAREGETLTLSAFSNVAFNVREILNI